MPRAGKILILGAGEGQVPLILRAREAGWQTYVVSPQGHYPGFDLAHQCCYLDISDSEGVLQLARKIGIDAIASDQTDISMPTVMSVAKEMGLPCIECECVDNFQYKSLMRDICRQKGIATIAHFVTDDIDAARKFYLSIPNGKAIVKPVDSQGSRGIHKVGAAKDIPGAISAALKYSRCGKIIIEQFVDGHEIEIDTVMKNGDVKCTMIGDVYNFSLDNMFSAYERIYPARLESIFEDRILNYNEAVLRSLGLWTGWTHGEYIVTEDKEVYLLEVGVRGGGNFIGSDILRTMVGVGTDEMAFLTAIGDDSFYDRVRPQKAHCAYKCFYLPEGKVTAVDIDRDYLTGPTVLRHNLDSLYVGKSVSKATDKTSRYTVVIKAATPKELRDILDDLENRIRVSVMTPDGLKEAIWR